LKIHGTLCGKSDYDEQLFKLGVLFTGMDVSLHNTSYRLIYVHAEVTLLVCNMHCNINKLHNANIRNNVLQALYAKKYHNTGAS